MSYEERRLIQPIVSHDYSKYLLKELKTMQEGKESLLPNFLAELVLDTPTSNEAWATSGYRGQRVATQSSINVYESVVITAFDFAARDPDITGKFLALLNERTDEAQARLCPNDTIENPYGFSREEQLIEVLAESLGSKTKCNTQV